MKVVLDTNVVISALLHRGPTRRFAGLWRSRKISLFVSQGILNEYIRVLHYPKFGYGPELLAELLKDELLPWLSKVDEYRGRLDHPPRDGSDEPFLRAALSAQAEVLVSGDPHLTSLHGKYPFSILPPAVFLTTFFRGGKHA